MAVMEITVMPKSSGTSVSKYIAEIIGMLETEGIDYQLTPMSTIIEGESSELLSTALMMHEKGFQEDIERVYTIIKIDDRRDRQFTAAGKVRSVMTKLDKDE
ncbi:MAG: MTH1187 family thiamine-binding protein [bacterium]